MTLDDTKSVQVGLVLQGGGALGAYEWGAVTALLELMDRAEASGFDIALKGVAGVSIGAINAACVVGSTDRRDAARRLAAVWDDLTLRVPDVWPRFRLDLSALGGPNIDLSRDLAFFGIPNFFTPRTDIASFPSWTSFYDTAALQRTLERHVDFRALNDSPTRFVVTAVDVVSGELMRFSNHASPHDEAPIGFGGSSYGHHVSCAISARHVLASGSLPPAFPWTTIDGRHYWDGGLVDNTPLAEVADSLAANHGSLRFLIVMNVYPLAGELPLNMAQVSDRIHELKFGNRLRQDRATTRQINALIETIEELADLVPPEAIDTRLRARLDEARAVAALDAVTHIDLQATGATRMPFDDESGMRDFSAATVSARRAYGYTAAMTKLVPLFTNHGLIADAVAPPPV